MQNNLTYQQRARHNEAWAMRRKLLERAKDVAQARAYTDGSAKWRMYLFAISYGVGWTKLCSLRKDKIYGD